MRQHVILILSICLFPGMSSADDFAKKRLDNWHQWRGPEANGMAPRGNPPVRWDQQTNVRWKTALPGRGSSTPIIWDDQVFILTAIDTGREADAAALPKVEGRGEKKTKAPTTYHQFVVLSIDRHTGKVRWRQMATEQVPHEGRHPSHSYAAGSPTTDGRYLYVSFGSRGIYCYDLTGKLQWKRELGRLNTRYGWGEAVTPTLHGDSLVVNWDQEEGSFIVCLDARTGETRWKADRDEPSSWATPLVVEHGGRTQVIVNATNRIRSYDLATGKVLWQCGGMTINAIPSPVVNDGVVFCMSGYRGAAALALPLDAKGDLTGSDKVIWRYQEGVPYVPSPLLTGDRLYFTLSLNAFLTCLDAKTGKPLFDRERLPGITQLYASPVCASGHIYCVGRDGTTVVIKRSDRMEIVATNRLDDPIDASPAVVGKQMFLRGEKNLYCIEGK